MSVARRLPEPIKAKLRPLRWPRPAWLLRGYGDLIIGGEKFRFVDAGREQHAWWAGRARHGLHEPEVAQFLRENIRGGDVFFDLGCYMGQYTLLGARLGARVVTFDPDPVFQHIVLKNLALNGLVAEIVAAAVGAPDDFLLMDPQQVGHSTSRAGTSPGLEVRTVGLDDYCSRHDLWPDVMKVDIEGAESVALGDAARTTLSRVRVLMIEIHEAELAAQGINPEAFVEHIGRGMRRVDLSTRMEAGTTNIGFVRG